MKKIIFALASASLITICTLTQVAYASDERVAALSAVLKNDKSLNQKDLRVDKLTLFLNLQGSPLAEYAQDFVEAADFYQLDWRLLAAITGVESTFGKQIPVGSFNAYGWNNGVWRFKSWPDSIEYVSRALKEKYFNRGLDTVAKIAPIYAPPSSTWAGKMTFFMKEMEALETDAYLKGLSLTL